MKHLKNKKVLIIAGIVLAIIALAVTAFLLTRKDKTQQSDNRTPASVNLSAEPGTYVTIQTGLGDMTGIQGLDQCTDQSVADGDISCQLNDENPSITLAADATVTKDGKEYIFQGWEGCTTSDSAARTCTITAAQGANLFIKARYTEKAARKAGAPFVELKVAGYTSVDGVDVNFGLRTPGGQSSVTADMQLNTGNLAMSGCTIVDSVILDDSNFTKQTNTYQPIANQTITLADGNHTIVATCPSTSGKLTAKLIVQVIDDQPKLCKNFSFTDGPSTANSLSDLKVGIVGTWQGCVTTPWLPVYWVTITFKSDGTYTASSNEVLDGRSTFPMYYGGQQDSPKDTYSVDNFQNGLGSGVFNIVFTDGSGSVVPEDMQNIKLMGNKLSFNFKHFNKYGPLNYQLTRQ